MTHEQTITTQLKPSTWFKAEQVMLCSKNQQITTRLADGFLTRLRGLLWSKPLQPAEGLLLSPCNNIHTIGMTYPIDVVFLSSDMEIVRIVPHCQPYRFANCKHAKHTLELLAGQAAALSLCEGGRLTMKLLVHEVKT